MTFRVLFVCAANICRSPTSVRIFAGRLPERLERNVVPESAGISARADAPWCSHAQTWVERHQVPVGEAPEHRSRRLTPALSMRAGLVVAADASVKAVVLRGSPRARTRLFTVLEAGTLAAAVAEALTGAGENRYGLQLAPMPPRPGDARMRWLVDEMDAARGLVPPLRTGLRNRVPELLDPHREGSHRTTLKLLAESVSALADAVDVVDRA